MTFPTLTPQARIKEPVEHIVKAQYVRLLDVFVIGPAMVWGGYKLFKHDKKLSAILVAAGIGTVVYNGHNYLRNYEQLKLV